MALLNYVFKAKFAQLDKLAGCRAGYLLSLLCFRVITGFITSIMTVGISLMVLSDFIAYSTVSQELRCRGT